MNPRAERQSTGPDHDLGEMSGAPKDALANLDQRGSLCPKFRALVGPVGARLAAIEIVLRAVVLGMLATPVRLAEPKHTTIGVGNMTQWLESKVGGAIAFLIALAIILAALANLGAIDKTPIKGMSVGASAYSEPGQTAS